MDRDIAAGLQDLLSREPAYHELYASAVERCAQAEDERALAAWLDGQRSGASQIKSGASLVDALVRHGGIARTILVDGQPYEGTVTQLQQDESVPDDAQVEFLVEATPEGAAAVAAWRADHSLAALFGEKPQFAPGFRVVLEQCRADGGKTTGELQDALIAAGVLAPGLADAQQLHASYFTSKLEQFGALAWDRKRWRTTQKGEGAIAQGA